MDGKGGGGEVGRDGEGEGLGSVDPERGERRGQSWGLYWSQSEQVPQDCNHLWCSLDRSTNINLYSTWSMAYLLVKLYPVGP